MKVLITGSTGFLGNQLTKTLCSRGYEVWATGRNKTRLKQLEPHGAHTFACELSSKEALEKTFPKSLDMVIHAAALSTPWGLKADFERANVVATQNIVDACQKYNVRRLVHISTPSIYMRSESRLEIRENQALPKKFMNEYTRSKYMGEKIVDKAAGRDLETIILRPQGLIGENDTHILPRIVKALRFGRIPLINNGNALLDLTHVDNVVDAIELCLNANGTCLNKAYNITNGDPRRIRHLFGQLFALLDIAYRPKNIGYKTGLAMALVIEGFCRILPGRPEPRITRYGIIALAHSRTLSIARANKLLGYRPVHTLDQALESFASKWRQS